MPGLHDEHKNAEIKERYNFLRQAIFFCSWPDACFKQTQNDFVLAVLGTEPSPELLDKMVLRMATVNNHRIVIRRFADLQKVTPCQILFVTSDVKPEVQQDAIDSYRGKPVLLIGEAAEFAKNGGCVGLIGKGGAIVKEFNTGEIKNQSVIVDLRLQKDGRFIETVPQKPNAPERPPEKPMRDKQLPLPSSPVAHLNPDLAKCHHVAV